MNTNKSRFYTENQRTAKEIMENPQSSTSLWSTFHRLTVKIQAVFQTKHITSVITFIILHLSEPVKSNHLLPTNRHSYNMFNIIQMKYFELVHP